MPKVKASHKKILEEVKAVPFIGIEAEGPLRGTVTLFLPGSLSRAEIEDAIIKAFFCVDHIYYGAGNDRQVSLDKVEFILEQWDKNLTIEVLPGSYNDFIIEGGGIVVTVWAKTPAMADSFLSNSLMDVHGHYVKFKSGTDLVWASTRDSYTTSLNDELFLFDRSMP